MHRGNLEHRTQRQSCQPWYHVWAPSFTHIKILSTHDVMDCIRLSINAYRPLIAFAVLVSHKPIRNCIWGGILAINILCKYFCFSKQLLYIQAWEWGQESHMLYSWVFTWLPETEESMSRLLPRSGWSHHKASASTRHPVAHSSRTKRQLSAGANSVRPCREKDWESRQAWFLLWRLHIHVHQNHWTIAKWKQRRDGQELF